MERTNGSFYFSVTCNNLISVPVSTGRQMHRKIRILGLFVNTHYCKNNIKTSTDIQLTCNLSYYFEETGQNLVNTSKNVLIMCCYNEHIMVFYMAWNFFLLK